MRESDRGERRRQPLQVLRKVRCRLLRYRLSLSLPRRRHRLRESLACCKAEVAATTKVLKITENSNSNSKTGNYSTRAVCKTDSQQDSLAGLRKWQPSVKLKQAKSIKTISRRSICRCIRFLLFLEPLKYFGISFFVWKCFEICPHGEQRVAAQLSKIKIPLHMIYQALRPVLVSV